MRILAFGAGVIGRIYAARLVMAGHEVSILSRGGATDELRSNGICLVPAGGDEVRVFPRVIESVEGAGHVDLVFVAVRLDQVDTVLVPLASLDADAVASLINLPLGTDRLVRAVGADRFVPAFPGVAGRLAGHGEVQYVQVAQQPTVIGDGPVREMVVSVLRSARFPIKATKDMDAWLKTHAIFISAFESALAAVSGDAHTLASDSAAVGELVRAVREGFTALHGRGEVGS